MSAIPALKRSHVEEALSEIRADGVPDRRASTKFCLVDNGQHFPPKYVVGLASERAAGRKLRPDEFSGGVETNQVLGALGFEIVECNCGGRTESASQEDRAEAPRAATVRPAGSTVRKRGDGCLIARVVLHGPPFGAKPGAAEKALLKAVDSLRAAKKTAKFLVTPGGFVTAPWPKTWRGRTGWETRPADLEELVAAASTFLSRVVTSRVLAAAKGTVQVITLGVDLEQGEVPRDPHAELVFVFEVQSGNCVAVTGKSYPVGYQEDTLVHVADLETHFVDVAGERVLVLGCHDLNLFSPRAYANQSSDGHRRIRTDEFQALARDFRPTVVLQHPHTTDTPRIWSAAWGPLASLFPELKGWASGIAFWNHDRPTRAPLANVLAGTRSDPEQVFDITLDT